MRRAVAAVLALLGVIGVAGTAWAIWGPEDRAPEARSTTDPCSIDDVEVTAPTRVAAGRPFLVTVGSDRSEGDRAISCPVSVEVRSVAPVVIGVPRTRLEADLAASDLDIELDAGAAGPARLVVVVSSTVCTGRCEDERRALEMTVEPDEVLALRDRLAAMAEGVEVAALQSDDLPPGREVALDLRLSCPDCKAVGRLVALSSASLSEVLEFRLDQEIENRYPGFVFVGEGTVDLHQYGDSPVRVRVDLRVEHDGRTLFERKDLRIVLEGADRPLWDHIEGWLGELYGPIGVLAAIGGALAFLQQLWKVVERRRHRGDEEEPPEPSPIDGRGYR